MLLPKNSPNCDNYDYTDNTTIMRGNISSTAISGGDNTQSCGSDDKPWIIKAKSGQTITLHLIDFSVEKDNRFILDQGDSGGIQVCLPYGWIKDVTDSDSKQICGGQQRNTHLLHSLGNQVEIRLNQDIKDKNFIVSFEGKCLWVQWKIPVLLSLFLV